ncbi:MAG: hypothetical protein HY741_28845 [Chloroflexi bacterium]|nr:hypothetical protein [Chloroflexota bacterium]
MKDYLLTFKVKAEMARLEEMTRQVIAIGERTKSDVAGGCDARRGEFYINASRRFAQSDLVEMVALLLPNVSNLTITTVAPVNTTKPHSKRAMRASRPHAATHNSQRIRTGSATRKMPAKI